jgi:cytochrome c-type biogenesis protein CcmH
MMFYAAAGMLLLSAAGWVTWALFRPAAREVQASQRADTVRELYQDRLQELAQEADAGQVASEDRAEMEAELGSVLLADFDSQPAAPVRDASLARPVLLATPLLATVLAMWIYFAIGDPHADTLRDGRSLLTLSPHGESAELESWRSRLSDRVAGRPQDTESWYLLGHTELLLGEYQRAAEAFAVAHSQVGPDAGLDMAWLQARYMAGGGSLDPVTREIAERIMARNPNQPLVLELFAVDAFRKENYREAVNLLNRALSGSLGENQRTALTAGLAEARRRLGNLEPSVDVNVSAAANAPANATLFVIARPVGGGMPYAVVKRSAPDLPATIRLDDAVSMNPALALSAAGEIEVVVRLSLSGAPMAHPGDWQWQSASIDLGALSAPLVLDAALAAPADS